jgi:hypothetical protein
MTGPSWSSTPTTKEKASFLNQGRLKKMIVAFGPNFDNWPGKKIIIRQGSTVYSGDTVRAIMVEPVVPARIAADPRKVRITIESGQRASGEPPSEINPPPIDAIDDDIPF